MLLIRAPTGRRPRLRSRITQVRAGFNDELRRILIAASDGTFASDTQPLARLNIFVIAHDATADNGAGRPRAAHPAAEARDTRLL